MVWTVKNPGKGNVSAIRRIATLRGTALSDVDAALTLIASTVADLPANWSGAAADSHLATIEAVVPDLQQLEQSYTNHRDALNSYAGSVESIQDATDPLIARIDQLEGDLDGLNTRRYNSPVPIPTPPGAQTTPLFLPSVEPWDEVDLSLARTMDADIKQTQQDLHQAGLQLGELVSERAKADAACVTALSKPNPPSDLTKTQRDAVDAVPGDKLAEYLLTLTTAQRTALLLDDPSILTRLNEAGPDNAGDVAALLLSIGPAAAILLALKFPRLVGNLEGVPYEYRDVANTKTLDTDIASLTAKLDRLKPGEQYDQVKAQLDALLQIDVALGTRRGDDPPRYLISFLYPDGIDSDRQPLAGVALGNLDTADNATYLVPGMDTNVRDSAVSWTQHGYDLYNEQQKLLLDSGSDESVAVVSWIGYETPDKLTVLANVHAEVGAERLGAALDGYNAVHDATGSNPHLGVVAHSYGSTTAMITLQEKHGVDSFTVFGSAGQVPFTSVDMPKEDYYYAMGPLDALAPIGQYGSHRIDPAIASLGNITMIESGAVNYRDEDGTIVRLDPALGEWGHTGYLDPGTSSLVNIAASGLGEDDLLVKNEAVRGVGQR